MNSSTPVLSASETMATLMRSMGKYVHRRIGTTRGKEAYRKAMSHCIYFVSSNEENLDTIKAYIEGWKHNLHIEYPNTLFKNRTLEREHHTMACIHALDIVKSIEARFITGTHDAAPRIYRDRNLVYHHDDDLFAATRLNEEIG